MRPRCFGDLAAAWARAIFEQFGDAKRGRNIETHPQNRRLRQGRVTTSG
jgi:hypothetical protein